MFNIGNWTTDRSSSNPRRKCFVLFHRFNEAHIERKLYRFASNLTAFPQEIKEARGSKQTLVKAIIETSLILMVPATGHIS